jgi:hypothetical protein
MSLALEKASRPGTARNAIGRAGEWLGSRSEPRLYGKSGYGEMPVAEPASARIIFLPEALDGGTRNVYN